MVVENARIAELKNTISYNEMLIEKGHDLPEDTLIELREIIEKNKSELDILVNKKDKE